MKREPGGWIRILVMACLLGWLGAAVALRNGCSGSAPDAAAGGAAPDPARRHGSAPSAPTSPPAIDGASPSLREELATDGYEPLLVVDGPSGRPIVGARVVDGRDGREILQSGEQGVVRVPLEVLRAGARVEAEGYPARRLGDEDLRSLPWDEARRAWLLELWGLGELSVTVVESRGGSPIVGVEVWLGISAARTPGQRGLAGRSVAHLSAGPWRRSLHLASPVLHAAFLGRTDGEGRVQVSRVPMGAELFVVARSDTLQEERALRLEHSPAELVIGARPGRILRGRWVWEDGRPLERGWFRLRSQGNTEEGNLGSHGEFVVPRVFGRHARLELLRPVPFTVLIDVEACDGDAGDLVVPNAGRLRGRVLAHGAGVPDVFVEVFQGGEQIATTATGPGGEFDLTVFAGAATLRVSSAWSRWDTPALEQEVTAPAEDLILDVGDRLAHVRLVLRGVREGTRVQLWEHLPDPDGEPRYADVTFWGSRPAIVGPGGVVERAFVPPGFRAWLVDAGESGCAWTQVVEVPGAGRLELGPLEVGFGLRERAAQDASCGLVLVSPVRDALYLPAGEGPALARLPAGPWAALPFAAGASAVPGSWFEVRTNDAGDLACPAASTGSLRGLVRGAGLPREGLQVELRRSSRHPELAGLAQARTDELGRFTFEALEAGPAYVLVHTDRERLATLAVELLPGQELEVEVEVDPTVSPSVVVFAEPGGERLDLLELGFASWSDGQGRPARALEGGAWAVPGGAGRTLFAARSVLHAHTGGGYGDAYHFGEAVLGPGTNRVVAYPGTLRVELGEEGHRLAPIAFLESVDGLDTALLTWGWPLNLARERVSDRAFVFHSVPPRARVSVWGQGKDGRPMLRQVEIRNGSPTHIAW